MGLDRRGCVVQPRLRANRRREELVDKAKPFDIPKREVWEAFNSMGSVGDAYDNAMAESFFSTLEAELLSRRRLRARARARGEAGNQRPWPADKVERWGIDRLIPYAKNARTHTDAQVAAIAASIKEWGWTTPALVGEDGGLIAGHARILAARQLGIAKIPVMVAAGWTEAQKRAYVLADNQLAITGSGWDPELLRDGSGRRAGRS